MGDRTLIYDFLEKLIQMNKETREDVLKELINVLSSEEYSLLLKTIDSIPTIDEKNKIISIFNKVLTESLFKAIVNNLFEIQNEPPSLKHRGISRENVLQIINTFTESAKLHDSFDEENKVFTPVINDQKKKYLIEVNFAGLGSEVNGVHYAIVWEAQNNRDDIVVIPTTSFKDFSTKEKPCLFNIGKVGHMSKETVVKLDQITTISRKRIRNVVTTDQATNAAGIAALTDEQVKRIQEGFSILFLGESSLFTKEILGNHKNRLPAFDDPVLQFSHLNRPYNIVSLRPDKVIYTLQDDSSQTQYTLYRNLTRLTVPDRNRLIFTWINSVAIYDRSTRPWTLIKGRSQVQQDAYTNMQTHVSGTSSA